MTPLTLIQTQVLMSLAEAQTHSDYGVRPAAVREKLLERRPRAVSEAYVRRILRELADQRLDGLPIVDEVHLGRGRAGFRLLNAGRARAQELLEEEAERRRANEERGRKVRS
jgi:hypothetical protein